MRLTLSAIVDDALGLWRRHRALLLPVAGLFLFLPLLTWLLLAPTPPLPPDAATSEQRLRGLLEYFQANLHWIGLRTLIETFGSASILVLLLSRAHRTLGEALAVAARLLPTMAAALLACWIAIGLGSFAFIVPGLYLYGRLALTGPVLAAEPGVGISGAIRRSVTLTRGHGWVVFGYLALPLLAGYLAAQLFGGVEAALGPAANPVARAILDALVAAIVSAAAIGGLLIQVALYRRLAAR